MQQIIHFISENWVLCGVFLVLLLFLVSNELKSANRGTKLINPQQLSQSVNHNDAVIIDVRSKDEFDTGHIVNAVNIDHKKILEAPTVLDKYKSRPMVLVCEKGGRCSMVAKNLKQPGFEQLTILNGGMGAWREAGMPSVKQESK